MSIYIVNIPSTSLVRKNPTVHGVSFDRSLHLEALAKARELDLSRNNVTTTIDGVAYLLSQNCCVVADNEADAIEKSKRLNPDFKMIIE